MRITIRSIRLCVLTAGAALFLGSCGHGQPMNPNYEPRANDATLKIYGGYPTICNEDGTFRLEREGPVNDQTFRMPSGKRVTVEIIMMSHQNKRTYYCYPSLSFIPEAGATYAMDSQMGKPTCTTRVVRVDNREPSGVAPEPTARAPTCRAAVRTY